MISVTLTLDTTFYLSMIVFLTLPYDLAKCKVLVHLHVSFCIFSILQKYAGRDDVWFGLCTVCLVNSLDTAGKKTGQGYDPDP